MSRAPELVTAALLSLAAVGCARVPPPPYPLNFTLAGHTPRLVEASRETTVLLTLANAGTERWDPARIHFAYHWLWFVPRELASRSRTLPYQDGIRSDLPRALAPGERVSIDARLLPPAAPGLYWLQWDMVDEGTTWFAQVAPRQPRLLVIVAPPLAWALAPVPLLLAVLGIVLARRIGRRAWLPAALVAFAATADIWWCFATLLAKEVWLVRDALLEPTPAGWWLAITAAAAPAIVLMIVAPRRARAPTLAAAGVAGSVALLGDIVYYRFFGDLLSAPALLGAHQTGHVWGSIRSLLSPGLLWTVVDLPAALWLVAELLRVDRLLPADRPLPLAAAATIAVAAGGAALGAPRVLASTPLDQMFRDRAVAEQLGPLGYHAYDAWNYVHTTIFRPRPTDAQVEQAAAWFAARAPLRRGTGPAFGAARGKNLIVVQVESLQEFAVDYVIDGQEVMPHLRRWTTDGARRFTNVTDETNQGRTSDAEFTAFTSLLPLDQGAAAFRYPGNHYVGLPRVLAEHGYTTLSAVAFEPGFWNRAVMHPAYGFGRSLFESDFSMTEQIGWGLNDRDFLQQMVPRLEQLPRPFAAWMITLSLHHPFEDFPAKHKELRLGALEGTAFGNYLHTMHFFDEAFDAFLQRIAADGLLDGSIVMVFGDHDAGFPHDAATTAAARVLPPDEVGWELADRIPWMIRVPGGVPGASGGEIETPAGQTDFAPTLLALAGIDAAPLPYVGRNLLGEPDDPPVLRPYGDWIDRTHLFLAAHAGSSCYAIARRAFDRDADCQPAASRAATAAAVSRLVIAGDLQQRLRTKLAALVQ